MHTIRHRRLRKQVKKILDQEEGLTPAKLVKRYPDYVTEHSLRRFKDSVGNPRPRVLHGIRSLVDHWHLDQPVAPGAVAVDECLPSQVPLPAPEPVGPPLRPVNYARRAMEAGRAALVNHAQEPVEPVERGSPWSVGSVKEAPSPP